MPKKFTPPRSIDANSSTSSVQQQIFQKNRGNLQKKIDPSVNFVDSSQKNEDLNLENKTFPTEVGKIINLLSFSSFLFTISTNKD